ncbi:MAG: type-F conjugative transfer system mating-pair stabilization protein TraN [Gammaproteobacteria bacterium]|nr:type-F conjugative transfer system mating-pair stabilization protein TraN [Gammaproteobacteria bacterium]
MRRWFFIFLMMSFNANAVLSDAYQEGSQFAQMNKNLSENLSSINLADIPGYQENIPESNFYENEHREEIIKKASRDALNTDAATALQESFDKSPYYQLNPKSEDIKKINDIAEGGEDLIKGQSTANVNCTLKPKKCEQVFETKACLISKALSFSCTKILKLEQSHYKTESYQLFVQNIASLDEYDITIDLNKPETCGGRSFPCYHLSQNGRIAPAISIPLSCSSIQIHIENIKGVSILDTFVMSKNPQFHMHMKNMSTDGGHLDYETMLLRVEILEEKERFEDDCGLLREKADKGLCKLIKAPVCVDKGPKTMGGNTYTRPCFQFDEHYICGERDSGDCKRLIDAGCVQKDSTCFEKDGARCARYQQIYQCPINHCTDNEIICGNGAFCLDGSCNPPKHETEDSFNQSVTFLTAAFESAKNLDPQDTTIFKGERLECSTLKAGVKNCCRDSGWGLDMHLAHCSDAERRLGVARQNNLVIPTGQYCYSRKRIPFGSICTDTHQTFCVFPSRLAKIIQEQGRFGQLHQGFGVGQSTNCTGISPEQLQSIHFEGINFSEFFSDIKNRFRNPNNQETLNQVEGRVRRFYAGSIHE